MSAEAAASDDAAPTLELRQFALRSVDAASATPISLCSHARRVGLVGDWEPLFQLLMGSTQAFRTSVLHPILHWR